MRTGHGIDRRETKMKFTSWENPTGTDGFEFIEYAAPDPLAMAQVFERMGFQAIARHRHKNVTLYRQGEINFILNAEPDSFAQRFARLHGPSVCAIAFRVHDAARAYQRATRLGAWGFANQAGPGELNIPAIKGVGDSLIYLVDRWRGKNGAQPGDIGNIGFYDVDFEALPGASLENEGNGLLYIDHLTHNVHRGRMKEWAEFYERIFNFREIRYFDIEGQVTGVKSKALTSPCGKIRIPINEEGNEKRGQITEYLDSYRGEGIQHIAMGARDLFKTVDALRAGGVKLLDTVDTYYELIDKRIPGHGENVAELKKRRILVDGRPGELLLQIFSENQLGPIFFEFIQRKGDEGFGEGNFKALFESIELDQMRRGVLKTQ
jgi:4-hydroxyphenylpyruvate dioxygenase